MTANPKLASDQKNLGNQGAFIDDNAQTMLLFYGVKTQPRLLLNIDNTIIV